VPEGNYLIGSITIPANTTLQMQSRANFNGSADIADYPIIKLRWEGEFREGHRALISAENASNVSIRGPGSIFGPPLSLSQLRNPRGPALIELSGCTNAVLENFTTQYQQLWSIHLLFCKNFIARNLIIRSVNFNGDGIDVDSCSGGRIDHCNIDTGDDAISLKSGRGMEAARINCPTENIIITNCSLVSSIFAGIGIGTELSSGIRNVRIENCYISGHQNSIYLKSRDGRGGYMENITGENLLVNNSPTFIGIDLVKKGIQASDPVLGDIEKWTRMSNITFNNIKVANIETLVDARNIPSQRPVDGFTLSNISGNCERGISLVNMTNVTLSAITVTGFHGDLLKLDNVKGQGLEKLAAKD
jgi:polygalacturonase